ncbi:MAG: alpha/beta-type small acid-soluble spore protein [Lachnospiraceae bacterium]
MTNQNKSGSNNMAVPEAKAAMNRFKEEVASELGVNLKDGYNGDLTSREAGSIGGEMVKKMIMKQEQQMSSGQ